MTARSPVAAGAAGHAPWGVLLACFFLSGATALVYEVVSARILGLVFGHTIHAVTTALAAFMGGLGLGSIILGRHAARFENPVRVYGVLEVAVGVSAAALPLLVWLASFVYLGLYRAFGVSYTTFGFVQFLLTFLILMAPTTLMGGTLPVLSQALVRARGEIGYTVSTLYACNTFGAVVGVVLAGYVLLPQFGNRITLAIAVATNVLVGVLAFAYGRRLAAATTMSAQPTQADTEVDTVWREPTPLESRAILLVLGLTGAVSMVYEIAWTRALALVVGSSTYAFSAMLLAFLLGIAGGAAIFALVCGRRRVSSAALAAIQCGIGLGVIFALLLYERLPDLVVRAIGRSSSPLFVSLTQFVASAHALLPSTLLLGAAFPCAVAAHARAREQIGRDVGLLYGVNTVGAIVGAVAAGFWLIPAIGIHASIKIGIAGNLVMAVVLSLVAARGSATWRRGIIATALVALVGMLLVRPWDPAMLSSGPSIYAGLYLRSGGGVEAALRDTEVLFHRDGASATVSVTRTPNNMSLRVNGKTDASTGPADMPTQVLLGHLPMLLHPNPKNVLVIGLGSGISVRSATRYAVDRVDVVEIEPAVVEAGRFFAEANGDVLRDPRVKLTIADGRNFLLTTPMRYDVIASEPSNPWLSGVASLFSLEFFELARQHLRPSGIMLQWVQAYSLLPSDFQMIVRTFRAIFPATSVWHVTGGDYLLVGRMDAVPLDLARLDQRYRENAGLREDLMKIGMSSWAGILGYFILGEADAARYAGNASLNTDDRLPLEFSAPRSLYLDTVLANWQSMRSVQTSALPDVMPDSRGLLELPEVRAEIGATLLRLGAGEDARRYLGER